MKIINFGLGVGTPDPDMSSKWADAVRILDGSGPLSVLCVHLQATDPITRSAFGEPDSERDHLLVVLSGGVLASGGGQIRRPVEAGRGIYWPRAEGYLVFATSPATALLIEGSFALHDGAVAE